MILNIILWKLPSHYADSREVSVMTPLFGKRGDTKAKLGAREKHIQHDTKAGNFLQHIKKYVSGRLQ